MAAKKKNKLALVYWPNCRVCQYMKKFPEFKTACLHSTYFDPNGKESLKAVNERYGNLFVLPTLYRHMTRHQLKDIQEAERRHGEDSAVWQRKTKATEHKVLAMTEAEKQIDKVLLENTVAVVEETKLTPTQAHEIGLDEFIAIGRDRLKHGDMGISASNYIAAIKVKAEIERTTKDRRLEMLKNMFVGAAPKKDE